MTNKVLFFIFVLFIPNIFSAQKKYRSIPFSIFCLKIVTELFSLDKKFMHEAIKRIVKISIPEYKFQIGLINITSAHLFDYGYEIGKNVLEDGLRKIPNHLIIYFSIDFIHSYLMKLFQLLKIDYPDSIKRNLIIYYAVSFYCSIISKRLLEKIIDKIIDSYREEDEQETDYLYEPFFSDAITY